MRRPDPARVLVDAVRDAVDQATAATWERRARMFEDARPVPGDYVGRASRAELSRRWRELTAIAQACRARAAVARGETVDVEVVEVLLDVLGEQHLKERRVGDAA